MCRLIAYKGNPIVLNKVLFEPKHSLINQSFDAKELEEPLNGDGFGIGWYKPEIDTEPAVFVSVSPAWNNRNLRYLAPKITSGCIMAHIRAASVGDVSELNCHPFHYQDFLMMHNGGIDDFWRIKRPIRNQLTDELYNWVKGQTDSEHLFALVITYAQQHAKGKEMNLEDIVHGFRQMIAFTNDAKAQTGIETASYLNMVITNGRIMVAIRYISDHSDEPLSLYYSEGSKYVCKDGVCEMIEAESDEKAVLIVSEKLTDLQEDWRKVGRNYFVLVDEQLKVEMRPIEPLE
jgi:predicted glutamine amidotransferase